MANYSALKVPELKKLLSERKLSPIGTKVDLIARLKEDDGKNATEEEPQEKAETKEDEINYSDDEAAKAAESKPAEEPVEKPVAEESAEPSADKVDEPAEESAEQPAAEKEQEEEEAKEPPPSFALGLTSSTADEELKKRADRAKRFGVELDEAAQKLAERAKRFGLEDKDLASGLDSALPERPLKRGRGRNEGDGNRPGKRRSQDRRGGAGGGERRSARNRGNANPNRGGDAAAKPKPSILEDPTEKAKAEKRAARFAAA